jgi:hypothetical protein
MDLTLYNKSWLVPAKCGTRHIDLLLGTTTQLNTHFPSEPTNKALSEWDAFITNPPNHIKMMIPSEHLLHYWPLPITHIVLRDPMSLLESALHTDLYGHHPQLIKGGGGFVSTNKELREWLLEYTTLGTGHWSPTLYKGIWYLLQIRPDIETVPLANLSEFLAGNDIVGEYIPSEYNFSKKGPSRKDIIRSVKEVFPEIWSIIQTRLSEEMRYYEYICKRKEMELPKVIGIHPKKLWSNSPKVKRLPRRLRKLI